MRTETVKFSLHNAGLYVHVPFCVSRCIYCDFFSTTRGDSLRMHFVDSLCREIVARKDEIAYLEIKTIYFGGGTPSLLSFSSLKRILDTLYKYYHISKDIELTLEANPDDLSESYVCGLKELGFNRVSLGVQSFCDAQLKFLNRRHDAQMVEKAIELLINYGISNISIDLIYALPGQNMKDWRFNLEKAFSLPIKHISAYALSYEKGTHLHRLLLSGKVKRKTDEYQRLMYQILLKKTRLHKFVQYEISNFALINYYSNHNSSYWCGYPYWGFGPGAHSFDGKRKRRWNLPDLDRYISSSGYPPFEAEELSNSEILDEWLMIGLRKTQGINLHELNERYGSEILIKVLRILYSFQRKGFIKMENGFARIKPNSFFISDYLILEICSAF